MLKVKGLLRKMFLASLGVMVLGGVSGGMAYAAETSLDIPLVSKYVWRGIQANEEVVLQPSLSVSGGDFSFNLWGNMDLTGFGEEAGYGNRCGEFTELDLTGEYGRSFGIMSIAVGAISYIFPGIGATTHELYATFSANVPAGPSLAIYSDVDEVKGSYFLLSLGHSFELKDTGPLTGIDLGVSAGYGSGSYNRGYFGIDKAAPVDMVASLALPLSFGKISVTPSAVYSHVLDSEISEALDQSGYFFFSLNLGLTL